MWLCSYGRGALVGGPLDHQSSTKLYRRLASMVSADQYHMVIVGSGLELIKVVFFFQVDC